MELMNALHETFPNIKEYFQLIPISVVGIFAGIVSYFGNEKRDVKQAIKVILTCSFLTIMIYSLLSATDLPYLAKVGLSAAVGYFGIDKAIELVQKLLALKNGNPNANKTQDSK